MRKIIILIVFLLSTCTMYAMEDDEIDYCYYEQVKPGLSRQQKKQLFKELCSAAKLFHIDTVMGLLRVGAPVEYGSKTSLTALIEGLASQTYSIVENNPNHHKKIILCSITAKKILSILIDAGADINKRLKSGQTIIMKAAFYAQVGNVELLLQKGADVSALDDEGHSAWFFADEYSDKYPLEYYMTTGDTFFHILFCYKNYAYDRKRCIDLLQPRKDSPLYEKYLIRQNIVANEEKIERLCNASLKLDVEAIKEILEEEIDFSYEKQGWFLPFINNPLWLMAWSFIDHIRKLDTKTNALSIVLQSIIDRRKRSKEIAELLTKTGYDVNKKGPNGQTTLMIAALSANAKLVKKLLKLGAKPSIQDDSGNSALNYSDFNSKIVEKNLNNEKFNLFAQNYSLAFDYQLKKRGVEDKRSIEEIVFAIDNLSSYKEKLSKVHTILSEDK